MGVIGSTRVAPMAGAWIETFDYAYINSRLNELESRPGTVSEPLADVEERERHARPGPSWSITGRVFRVYFDPRRNIFSGQEDVIDRAVRVIRLAEDCIVQIDAHTDSAGDHFRNMQLGAERGLMVRHALMARGIPGQRIEVTSHGPDRPTRCRHNPSDPEREDALNRRVEIRLTARRGD